jgi:hypothetical protein
MKGGPSSDSKLEIVMMSTLTVTSNLRRLVSWWQQMVQPKVLSLKEELATVSKSNRQFLEEYQCNRERRVITFSYNSYGRAPSSFLFMQGGVVVVVVMMMTI